MLYKVKMVFIKCFPESRLTEARVTSLKRRANYMERNLTLSEAKQKSQVTSSKTLSNKPNSTM